MCDIFLLCYGDKKTQKGLQLFWANITPARELVGLVNNYWRPWAALKCPLDRLLETAKHQPQLHHSYYWSKKLRQNSSGTALRKLAQQRAKGVEDCLLRLCSSLMKCYTSAVLPELFGPTVIVMQLRLVLGSFQQAVKRTLEGSLRPPIIIDEADKFTSWSVTYAEELRTLLSFFVAITKEENMTRVFLMTSDYAFIKGWLEKGEHTVFPGPHGCCQVVP